MSKLMQKLSAAGPTPTEARRPSMAGHRLSVPSGPGRGRRVSGVGLGGQRSSTVTQGPSLRGLLASKRIARQFAFRIQSRMRAQDADKIPIQKEPSYRMEPHRKFNAEKVKAMLETFLEEKIGKLKYSPKLCPNMCKLLSEDIKDKVKKMNFDRYKVVAHVTIGQKRDPSLAQVSRCTWDDRLDNFASWTFQNEHIFCTATVFGIYSE